MKGEAHMARRTFFSFYYKRDIWRASIVRNSWLTQGREAAGFWDASLWEEARKKGDDAIRRMINNGLNGTSVTVVLIGAETSTRPWVKYEIQKSREQGNGLLGVYIDNIEDSNGYTDSRGLNPLAGIGITVPTYDYIYDSGYSNLGSWIESAARAAGR